MPITPFPIGKFMALTNGLDEEKEKKNVLDPCCGSGRLLIAAGKTSAVRHNLYGIDILPICVKMAVVNVFLNGQQGEVICANGLNPDDFRFGYTIKSSLPPYLGIWKISEAKNSVIWNTNQVMKKEWVDKQKNQPPDDGQLVLF